MLTHKGVNNMSSTTLRLLIIAGLMLSVLTFASVQDTAADEGGGGDRSRKPMVEHLVVK